MRVVIMPYFWDWMKLLSSLILVSTPGSSLFLALYLSCVSFDLYVDGEMRKDERVSRLSSSHVGCLCEIGRLSLILNRWEFDGKIGNL